MVLENTKTVSKVPLVLVSGMLLSAVLNISCDSGSKNKNADAATPDSGMAAGEVGGNAVVDETSGLGTDDPELRNCDLGDYLLKDEARLSLPPGCEKLTFNSIKLEKGAKLSIEPGVILQRIEKDSGSKFEADPGSTLIAEGQEDKPIVFVQQDPGHPLRLVLGGSTVLKNVKLENTTLGAFSRRDKKSFVNVKMDVSKLPPSDLTEGFSCVECGLDEFKNISIAANDGIHPFATSLRALEKIAPGDLTITGVAEPKLLIGSSGQLFGPTERETGEFTWPNLGYTYRILRGISLSGFKSTLSPGLVVEFCEKCTLVLDSKSVAFGGIGREPVTLKGADGKSWIGVYTDDTEQSIDMNALIVKDTTGMKLSNCKDQFVSLKLSGKKDLRIAYLEVETKTADLMSIGDGSTLRISDGAQIKGLGRVLRSGDLSAESMETMVRLTTEYKIPVEKCGDAQ